MRRIYLIAAIVTSLLALAACKDGEIYTLYRNSPLDPSMRIHMATFDAGEPGDYNQANCEITKDLFINFPGVTARYWCEKGRYRE